MSEKILVPVLGESITEATVAKWLKNQGETVQVDEPIVELETDKVNLEVPSPVNGVLGEILAKNGEIVEVGAILGSISGNGIKPKTSKPQDTLATLAGEKKLISSMLLFTYSNNICKNS